MNFLAKFFFQYSLKFEFYYIIFFFFKVTRSFKNMKFAAYCLVNKYGDPNQIDRLIDSSWRFLKLLLVTVNWLKNALFEYHHFIGVSYMFFFLTGQVRYNSTLAAQHLHLVVVCLFILY